MTTHVSHNGPTLLAVNKATLGQNLAAIAFGALVLIAVGFAPMDVVHNAAHDVRHAHAFPCH